MVLTLADVPINTMIKVHKNNVIHFYTILYHQPLDKTFVSYWSKDGYLCDGFLWSSNYFLHKDFTILGTNKILEV